MEIKDIEKINVSPTDVIIVTIDRKDLPNKRLREYADDVKLQMRKIFPDNHIIVKDDKMKIEVVTEVE